MKSVAMFALAAVVCASIAGGRAKAAEIKVLLPGAMVREMTRLIEDFERNSSHKVISESGNVFALTDRVQKGEIADVLVVTGAQIDDLIAAKRVLAGSKVRLAKIGAGVFVRKGAPKPAIGSVDAFKNAMLSAKSVAYTDPKTGNPLGVHIAGVFDRLGIAAAMKSKARLTAGGAPTNDAVVAGEAEIGFTRMNEIIADPRVDMVGPLPAALQSETEFAAGIVAAGSHPEAGKAFTAFLSSPASQHLLKAMGYEAP